MSQDNNPPEPKPEAVKPLGVIRISVAVMIPRTDYPQVSSQADCEPMFFNIYKETKNAKELPDGLLKPVREVLGEMVELIRVFEHPALTEEQRLRMSGLEKVEKPKGRPQVQAFMRNAATGEARPIGQPIFLDAQGNEMHHEKP